MKSRSCVSRPFRDLLLHNCVCLCVCMAHITQKCNSSLNLDLYVSARSPAIGFDIDSSASDFTNIVLLILSSFLLLSLLIFVSSQNTQMMFVNWKESCASCWRIRLWKHQHQVGVLCVFQQYVKLFHTEDMFAMFHSQWWSWAESVHWSWKVRTGTYRGEHKQPTLAQHSCGGLLILAFFFWRCWCSSFGRASCNVTAEWKQLETQQLKVEIRSRDVFPACAHNYLRLMAGSSKITNNFTI